jgi:hypothetical protein
MTRKMTRQEIKEGMVKFPLISEHYFKEFNLKKEKKIKF